MIASSSLDPPAEVHGNNSAGLTDFVFDLSHPCRTVPALGNHAVWAAALHYIAQRERFDAYVVPIQSSIPGITDIWAEIFGADRILASRPAGMKYAAPAEREYACGLTAESIFEAPIWESGFSLSEGEVVELPALWKSAPDAHAAMIFPVEYTDRNAFYTLPYWLELIRTLKDRGYAIHLLGVTQNIRDRETGHGASLIGEILRSRLLDLRRDRLFDSSLESLKACIALSSVAIGGSTGPSWACLLSDIEQIALDAPRPHSLLWRFAANAPRISKKIRVVNGYDPVFPSAKRLSIHVGFPHGLGDCSNFARILARYVARGHDVYVGCTDDKAFVFQAIGATTHPNVDQNRHPWDNPLAEPVLNHGQDTSQDWLGNKTGCNLVKPPLPEIGTPPQLWQEVCKDQIDLTLAVAPDVLDRVRRSCLGLPRPIVLLHSIGNTCQSDKSMPAEWHMPFYREYLSRLDGTLILLDWDDRMPALASYRIRRHKTLFGFLPVEELVALFSLADLLIGVDSGPLNLAGLTRLPSIGLFRDYHTCTRFSVPSPRMLALSSETARDQNLHKRMQWNIVEERGEVYSPAGIAEMARKMVGPRRYLPDGPAAADVQLQQFVSWCNGTISRGLTPIADRHLSFDRLLREATARFERPRFVETGTIRHPEDWEGAGFSTYLFGAYLHRRGGSLDSVDLCPKNCRFARDLTQVFGSTVRIHESRGDTWLKQQIGPIDVLFLDSMDTDLPGHQQVCLDELHAALPHLHDRSLVAIDDTPYCDGQFIGKGALAVPWLLSQGWEILYAGYQVVMSRVEKGGQAPRDR